MDTIFASSSFMWTFIITIFLICIGTNSDMGKISSQQNHFGVSSSQFTTKNNTRVIAQKGGLAVLPCVVKINSPVTVSWIRRKDFQLLTVGLSTHSSDKRFLVEHTRHMGHWSLRIKSVREEDRGLYECQLSIYPTQSIFIELKVVEATAEITGAPDLHIDEGSTLRLECKLRRATENPAFVFWYRDNKMVNYDTQDGFSVTSTLSFSPNGKSEDVTLKQQMNEGHGLRSSTSTVNHSLNFGPSSHSANHLQSSYLLSPSMSILTIQKVHFHHAGNYTCSPSNARSASITVHVLRGEKPAAMQHGNRSALENESGNATLFSGEINTKSSASAFYVREPFGILGNMVKQLFRNHFYKVSFWQLLAIVALIFTNQKIER